MIPPESKRPRTVADLLHEDPTTRLMKQADRLRPTLALQQQMSQYAELAQKSMALSVVNPLQGLSESLWKAMDAPNAALRNMQKMLGSSIRFKLPVLEFTQNLPSVKILENLRSSWYIHPGSLAQSVYELGKKLQDTMAVDAKPLLTLGWHLTPCMDFPDFFEALEKSTDAEKDACFSELVRGHLEEIISDVLTTIASDPNRFGGEEVAYHRRRLLAIAFDAHKAGSYSLSIPALFAQVDGLSLAGLGEPMDGRGPFFSSKEDRGKKLKRLARAAGSFKMLEAPLLGPSVYGIQLKEYLAGDRKCPNRHAVLHGRDLVFDTELNSLKIITLVGYTVWLISEIEPGKTDLPATERASSLPQDP